MKKVIWISVNLLLCSFMSSASAATIFYDDLYGTSESIEFSYYDNNSDIKKDTSQLFGEFQMTADPANIILYGYCIEPTKDIWTEGTYQYELLDLDDLDTYNYQVYKAAWLLNEWSSDAGSSGTGTNDDKKHKAVALQLAVWETLYSGRPLNVYKKDSSNNSSYSNTNNYYTQYMSSLLTQYDKTEIQGKGFKVADLFDFYGEGNSKRDIQNIIVRVVPEPTTMLLFGMGLLGLGAIGRKRRI